MNTKNLPTMQALCLELCSRLIHNHYLKKAEAYESRPLKVWKVCWVTAQTENSKGDWCWQ